MSASRSNGHERSILTANDGRRNANARFHGYANGSTTTNGWIYGNADGSIVTNGWIHGYADGSTVTNDGWRRNVRWYGRTRLLSSRSNGRWRPNGHERPFSTAYDGNANAITTNVRRLFMPTYGITTTYGRNGRHVSYDGISNEQPYDGHGRNGLSHDGLRRSLRRIRSIF